MAVEKILYPFVCKNEQIFYQNLLDASSQVQYRYVYRADYDRCEDILVLINLSVFNEKVD